MAGLRTLFPSNWNRGGGDFSCIWIRVFRPINGGVTKSLNGSVASLDGGYGAPSTMPITSVIKSLSKEVPK